jgi:hypothetical protein
VFEEVEEPPNRRLRPADLVEQAGTLSRLDEGEAGGAELVEVAGTEGL